jgi:hypothetical protein
MPHVIERTPSRPNSRDSENPRLDLVSWGVPFRLSASSEMLLAQMRRHAPFGSKESTLHTTDASTFSMRHTGTEARYQVLADGRSLTDPDALAVSLRQLGSHLTIHVAEWAPEYVFLHAGVVGFQDRALLLPGFSYAGKSTLVAELVRCGATYYSDEFALLDPDGCVHPFLRTLQMRRPGRPEQTPLPLAHINGRAGTVPLTVALVVFTEFVEGARWTPDTLTRGQGVLEMLRHAVPARRTPTRVLSTLTATMRHATAWQSRRGEAPETASALLAALAEGCLA